MRIRQIAPGTLLALGLGACTTNNLVIVAPPNRSAGPLPVSCWSPEDKQHQYLTPRETLQAVFVAPEFAKSKHINGCAALVFQLTKAGKAQDIKVLRELPVGYGFAEAFSEQLRRSTFAPPASEQDWYYRALSITFSGPAPVQPPPQQVPAPSTPRT